MPDLLVQDFSTDQINTKGKLSDILLKQVPRSFKEWRVAQERRVRLFLPLRQDFTLLEDNTAGIAATLTLDYGYATNPTNAIGNAVALYISTDGTTFTAMTKVAVAPTAPGEYQLISAAAGTIKVWLPQNTTRYYRAYYRPIAGRLVVAKRPSTESADQITRSIFEIGLNQIHAMDQIHSFTRIVFGPDAIFPANYYLVMRLLMPDQTATQSVEAHVTKTVTRAGLYIPRSTDSVAWDTTEVGLIELPLQEVF